MIIEDKEINKILKKAIDKTFHPRPAMRGLKCTHCGGQNLIEHPSPFGPMMGFIECRDCDWKTTIISNLIGNIIEIEPVDNEDIT